MKKKYIVFSVRDGTTWGVPAEVVAESKAQYYSTIDAVYQDEYDEAMSDDYELIDWAGNNMDWDDIKPHIVKLADPRPMRDVDYHFGWQESSLQVLTKEDENALHGSA